MTANELVTKVISETKNMVEPTCTTTWESVSWGIAFALAAYKAGDIITKYEPTAKVLGLIDESGNVDTAAVRYAIEEGVTRNIELLNIRFSPDDVKAIIKSATGGC